MDFSISPLQKKVGKAVGFAWRLHDQLLAHRLRSNFGIDPDRCRVKGIIRQLN
jgi:hypothetical protein